MSHASNARFNVRLTIRYLWTDAHGVCNLVSLYHYFGDDKYIEQAEAVVADVYRVLGRNRGLRIGEDPDRDGQLRFHLPSC